ncbi:MAG: PAQR family membrane homeostasis protein TrhA [Myxococcaceae bacterium]
MSALVEAKPKLRGVLHQWAAVWATGAGLAMVAMSPNARAALAGAIYMGSLVVLFTTSAFYHRVTWSPAAREWMRRMDHSAIFLLIAGTYTPIALIGLRPEQGNTLMLAIWSAAGLGILVSLFWIRAPKIIVAALALAVGWTLAPYFSDVKRELGLSTLWLLLAGGLAYSLGALAYAAKRPNLKPGVFGYHELFHALTLFATAVHFTAVARVLKGVAA